MIRKLIDFLFNTQLSDKERQRLKRLSVYRARARKEIRHLHDRIVTYKLMWKEAEERANHLATKKELEEIKKEHIC